jgi:7-cyano-7-deazaguanine synthase in queuosine biosynthesis
VSHQLQGTHVVVLAGGGIETAALIPMLLAAGAGVTPLHVRCGFGWETHEAEALTRCCERLARPALKSIVEIGYPIRDLLADHWAVSGVGIPGAHEDAARLEIPLRNITLLTVAAIRFRDIPGLVLATGTTADNHFGDGSRAFFDQCETVLGMAFRRPVRVLTPFIGLTKTQVIQQAEPGDLDASWSCVDPQGDKHCGCCIKCGRRRAAFVAAGVTDPTLYAGAVGAPGRSAP